MLAGEGLSGRLDDDRRTGVMIKVFRQAEADLAIGSATVVEVTHGKADTARIDRLLSRLRIEPLTEQASRAAAGLLENTGPHGHEYAVDATVAEVSGPDGAASPPGSRFPRPAP
ncbi:hypothetical protein [Streptomyces sp. Wb2n-11]|uniref:hypothetical protein n=1 Tax=Streptomyces sp. Wb2n-11 TaxID=1030533 RepID=UPI000B807B0A|nr:hypothetical protein [Streptomyces sp. Wb2n-11]